jgi:hypothetical protein
MAPIGGFPAASRRPAVASLDWSPAVDRATEGRPMDYLYSLYDALFSVQVRSEKARAVVE